MQTSAGTRNCAGHLIWIRMYAAGRHRLAGQVFQHRHGNMRIQLFATVLAGLVFALAAAPVTAQHAHEHDTHHNATPAAIPAQRWATDAPLREGMRRVREALKVLQHYPMGHVSEAMALDQVQQIKDAGAYMFANCKLPAEPDEALHGMLVPLLAAAHKLEDNPADTSHVRAMREAIADYPRYFDDPAWSANDNAE